MLEWWKPLSQDNKVKILLILLAPLVAWIIGFGTDLFGGKTGPTTKINTGDSSAVSTGSGHIYIRNKTTHEYDKEKLITFAHKFAKKNREQDAERIKELERTVIALSQQNKDKYNIDEALDLLSKGKPEEAEKIFELVALEAKEQGQEANIKEAGALRHIGSLAYLHNTQKALDAYKRSTELDPDSMFGWNQLGHLYKRTGKLIQAESVYKTVLELAENGKAWQAAAYGSLGLVYRARGDLDKAIEFHEKSLVINQELGSNKGMAGNYGNLGTVYRIRGDLVKAIEFHEESLAINQELDRKTDIACNYGNLGLVYRTRGDLDEAIKFHEKSLAVNQELGSKEGMAGNYGNLGVVYQTQGDLGKAIEFHEKSLAINQELVIKEGMAKEYGNLGLVYQTRGDLDKAIGFHEKSLAINQELGSKEGMAGNYGNLGNVYQTRGDLDEAIKFHEKSLAVNQELGSKAAMASNYGNLGNVYRTRGDLDKAIEYWKQSLSLFTDIGAKREMALLQSWIN